MQQHGHPYIFAALLIGKREEHTQRHADDELRRDALQRGLGAVEEKIQRQMPQPPQHTYGQRTAPCAEAALQGWRQIIAPAVFLTEERQEG